MHKLTEREAEIKIMSGSRISCFYGIGIQDSQREQSGIWDFNPSLRMLLKPWSLHSYFLTTLCFHVTHDTLSKRGLPPKLTSAKTSSGQKQTYCAYSCASRNAFIRKKVLSPNFREREDAESFEINCHMCLQAIFWIREWAILHWYRDKRKENSKLTVYRLKENDNHLCLLICCPLNSFVIFYPISFFFKFLCYLLNQLLI